MSVSSHPKAPRRDHRVLGHCASFIDAKPRKNSLSESTARAAAPPSLQRRCTRTRKGYYRSSSTSSGTPLLFLLRSTYRRHFPPFCPSPPPSTPNPLSARLPAAHTLDALRARRPRALSCSLSRTPPLPLRQLQAIHRARAVR